VVTIKTAVLRDVTSQELAASIFRVQEIPKIEAVGPPPRNISEHLPNYTAAYSRTLDLSVVYTKKTPWPESAGANYTDRATAACR
jgi:hypothetical protein